MDRRTGSAASGSRPQRRGSLAAMSDMPNPAPSTSTRHEVGGNEPTEVRGGSPLEAARVRSMFGSIAHRYDLLNRVLSLGLDVSWRREAIRVATADRPAEILDVATGTADVALGLKRAQPESRVVGVDFAEPMLAIGREKAARDGLAVTLEQGDGTDLPYEDGSFDAVTIAYGLRNFSDYRAGLREFHRILRPGGQVVILEFPPPQTGPLGRLFRLYFRRVLPVIGGAVSGNPGAYAYLPRSVLAFPPPAQLADAMYQVGFVDVRYKLQTLGISALHAGRKAGVDAGPEDWPRIRGAP
jgi:demethylmenaquinone methyltransferase/2-methoxy-6-polyprenyl-1,4-benzoquinol methylase